MPRIIERGPTHILPQARGVRWLAFAQLAALAPPAVSDPGTHQRAVMNTPPLVPQLVAPVAQRLGALPANEYAGETQRFQRITAAPGLDQVDPVAGVSAHGAGMPAILPSRHRIPVT